VLHLITHGYLDGLDGAISLAIPVPGGFANASGSINRMLSASKMTKDHLGIEGILAIKKMVTVANAEPERHQSLIE
jgi:hypothetical protein